MLTQVTRSGPSASTASSATSAESMPAGEAEHHALEAVLVHVVAQAGAQRGVDLLLGAEHRRHRAAHLRPRAARRSARPAATGVGARRRRARARTAVRWRGSRRRAAATAPGSTVQSVSASSNCGARATTSPSWSSATLWPSKTSSSWPPTRVAEQDRRQVVARALDEHPLALRALAGVVGRGRQVHDHLRAGQRLGGGRRPRLPDVLADREPDRDAVRARTVAGRSPAWK